MLTKAFHSQAMMYEPGMIVPIQGLFDYVAAQTAPEKSGEKHGCMITKIDCVGNNCKPERRVIRLVKLILAEWIVCVCK